MLIIKLKPLTPLWTGDIDRDSGRIKETGIIGSLRWWYEGIIRGMGGYASSDPRTESEVPCPVAKLFGSTHSARRFVLRGSASSVPLTLMTHHQVYVATGNWLYRMFGSDEVGGQHIGRGRDVKFDFNLRMLWADQMLLRVIPRFQKPAETEKLLEFVLHSACSLAALGSKRQNGFGVAKVIGGVKDSDVPAGRTLALQHARESQVKHSRELRDYDAQRRGASGKYSSLFDLRDSFFRIYQIREPKPYQAVGRTIGKTDNVINSVIPSRLIPCAFDIRYKSNSRNPFSGQGRDFGLRPHLTADFGQDVANDLLGESRPQREHTASRIFVSHLFRETTTEPYQLRIWGYVPPGVARRFSADKMTPVQRVAAAIDDFITGPRGMFPGSTTTIPNVQQEILGL